MTKSLKASLRKETKKSSGFVVAICTRRKVRRVVTRSVTDMAVARKAAASGLLTEPRVNAVAVITNGVAFLTIPRRNS